MDMKKIISLLLFSSALVFANAKETISLDQLIDLALQNNPSIKLSKLNIQVTLEQKNYVDGQWLPNVDLSAKASQGQYNSLSGVNSDTTLFNGTIRASQLIYDFGKTGGIIDAKQSEVDAKQEEFYSIVLYKIFEVKRDYYEVMKSNKLIDVAQKNLTLSKQHYHRAKRFYELGIRTKVDVSDAEVKVVRAKIDLKTTQYNKKLSVVKLIKSVGLVPDRLDFKLDGAKDKIPYPNTSKTLPKLEQSLDYYYNYALKNRHELKRQEFLIDNSQQLIDAKEGNYYPRFSLDAMYSKNSIDTNSPLEDFFPDSQWNAAVNLKWNLFEGSKTDSKVQEAKIVYEKTKILKQDIKIAILKDVTDAYLLTRKAQDIVLLSESLVKTSTQKYNMSQEMYSNDLSDYIELQEAQNEHIKSLANLANSYFDYFISKAYLELAIGQEYSSK